MDRISGIPEDITNTILSFANNDEEVIEMALLLPGGGKSYDKIRNTAEYWEKILEWYLYKPLPLKYAENATKLERFYNILRSKEDDVCNQYLPELLNICDLASEGYIKRSLKSLVLLFIEKGIEVAVNLTELVLAKPYFKPKMFNVRLFKELLNKNIEKFLPFYRICKKYIKEDKLDNLASGLSIEFGFYELDQIKKYTDEMKAEIPDFYFKIKGFNPGKGFDNDSANYLFDGIQFDNLLFPEMTKAIINGAALDENGTFSGYEAFPPHWNPESKTTHNMLVILLANAIKTPADWRALRNTPNLEEPITDLEEILSDPMFDNLPLSGNRNSEKIKEALERLKKEYKGGWKDSTDS